jgi:hypothetical protein
MPTNEQLWSVEDHLRNADAKSVALFRLVEEAIYALGPVTVSVSKSSITFKGSRRGFVGARPTARGVVGYFDLMRELPSDRRLGAITPYGRNLFVHHYVLTSASDLDDEFKSWLKEAYAIGCGAHLIRREGAVGNQSSGDA